MNLVLRLPDRLSPSGKHKYRYGLFACNYCLKTVERLYQAGFKQMSCGCLGNFHGLRHGHCRGGKSSPIALVFHGMKDRCYNPKNPRFKRYGGRGITICQEWLEDPALFFNWAISNGWSLGLQIDRKENDLGYIPDNCRFVPSFINGRNRSTTKLNQEVVDEIRLRFHTDGASITDISLTYGFARSTIADVIKNRTWILREGLC